MLSRTEDVRLSNLQITRDSVHFLQCLIFLVEVNSGNHIYVRKNTVFMKHLTMGQTKNLLL